VAVACAAFFRPDAQAAGFASFPAELDERAPDAIRTAVRAVLSDLAYRASSGRLRDEIAALPVMGHAVGLLERLARERRPLPGISW
jgi:UDP:flavonoid glycosyltransferase YjiC (YdhE family)